jgi:hypothetical protein
MPFLRPGNAENTDDADETDMLDAELKRPPPSYDAYTSHQALSGTYVSIPHLSLTVILSS